MSVKISDIGFFDSLTMYHKAPELNVILKLH